MSDRNTWDIQRITVSDPSGSVGAVTVVAGLELPSTLTLTVPEPPEPDGPDNLGRQMNKAFWTVRTSRRVLYEALRGWDLAQVDAVLSDETTSGVTLHVPAWVSVSAQATRARPTRYVVEGHTRIPGSPDGYAYTFGLAPDGTVATRPGEENR